MTDDPGRAAEPALLRAGCDGVQLAFFRFAPGLRLDEACWRLVSGLRSPSPLPASPVVMWLVLVYKACAAHP